MQRILSADFNCMDRDGRIWGIKTENARVGEHVLVTDGELLIQAVIEQGEHSLVARLDMYDRVRLTGPVTLLPPPLLN